MRPNSVNFPQTERAYMHSGNETKRMSDTFRRALSHPHAGLNRKNGEPLLNLDFTGTEGRADRDERPLKPGVQGPASPASGPFERWM